MLAREISIFDICAIRQVTGLLGEEKKHNVIGENEEIVARLRNFGFVFRGILDATIEGPATSEEGDIGIV